MSLIPSLTELFRQREAVARIEPPPLRTGATIRLPDRDPEDMMEPAPSEPPADCLSFALFIEYRDAVGCDSARRITVYAVDDRPGGLLVYAYCHEREAARTFRADRIVSCTDLGTGEILEEPDRIIRAVAGLATAPRESAEEATQAALRICRPGVVVLLVLARCDGRQHPSETDVILDFIDYACPPPGLDERYARDILSRMRPDRTAFERAVNVLARTPDELLRVARCARKLVDADGALTPEEAEFAVNLQSALSQSRIP